MQASARAKFVDSLNVIEEFSNALPLGQYSKLPDDWLVATTDVVQSRKAISEGRYKAVNMAGVAMISAVMNALGEQNIPYIFGGDGSSLAFPPDDEATVRDALSRTVRWVSQSLDLELRAAIVPVSELQSEGHEVLTVCVRVSPTMTSFAFAGGGMAVAEEWMKEGRFGVAQSAEDELPDLAGLSCRWTQVRQAGHEILSLIVEPTKNLSQIEPKALQDIFELLGSVKDLKSPMPSKGPGFSWPPAGLDLEAKATGMGKPALYLLTLLAWFLDRTGIPLGKFDPKRYREVTSMNTDYRKIQDGIRMTLALSEDTIEELEERLEAARARGQLRYGICRQDSAVLTCFVPSIMEDDHFHFLDGAGGGYAEAASCMR